MYIQLNEENRIVASSEDALSVPGAIAFDLPDDFDFRMQRDYKIEDGQLFYAPETEPSQPSSPEEVSETLSSIEAALRSLQESVLKLRPQLESQ